MSLFGPDLIDSLLMPTSFVSPLALYMLMMTPMLPVTVVEWA